MENQRKLKAVALALCPLQGHITPLLQLGTLLHQQGFSVNVLHPEFNSPNFSNHPEFTFLPLQDNLPPQEVTGSSAFQFISDLNTNCRSSLQDHMIRLKDHVACVIYDPVMKIAESVADLVGIPSIVFRTNPAANLLAYQAILQLHENNQIPLPESRLDETVPSIGFIRFKDLPFNVAAEIPKPVLELFVNSLKIGSSKAYIWNSVESLEILALPHLEKHYQIPFFTLGPIHKMAPHNSTSLMNEDSTCLKWLDKQSPRSVIYVSMGSTATVDAKELIETAWGLIESEQPFLWVIRPNSVEGFKWTECLPDDLLKMIDLKGCIVKWAPQKEILAHSAIGAFLCHCGWNSTLEGISEGVPALCRPFFIDQKLNARYLINEWKVGIELENARDRTVVKDAIRRLLVDDEGKEMRERSVELSKKLEICVQKGGSSYESLDKLVQFILSL